MVTTNEYELLIAVENSGGKWGTQSSGYPLVGSSNECDVAANQLKSVLGFSVATSI
jgi:hypothetical protein